MTGKIMPLCKRSTSTIQAVADAFMCSPRYASRNTRRGYTGNLGPGGSLRLVAARRSHGMRLPPNSACGLHGGRRLPAPYRKLRYVQRPAVFTAVGSSYANGTPAVLFINHSCEPNVGFAGNTVLVATRDISPGEELITEYALFDDHDGMMRCRCGTPSCRATIGDQDWQRQTCSARTATTSLLISLPGPARQLDCPS